MVAVVIKRKDLISAILNTKEKYKDENDSEECSC